MKKKKPKPQFSYSEIILVISVAAVVTGWTCAQVYRLTDAEDNPPVEQAATLAKPYGHCRNGFFPMRDETGIHCFSGTKDGVLPFNN